LQEKRAHSAAPAPRNGAMQRPATGSKKDSIDLFGTGVLRRLTLMKTGTSIVLLRLRNSIVKEKS
jgi:hypothetical protein